VIRRYPRPRKLRINRNIYVVLSLPQDELELFLNDIAIALQKGHIRTLACDEGHVYLRHGQIPQEFMRILRAARHYNLNVYIATQRLVDIDPDVRAVLTDILIFRTLSERDLSLLRLEYGKDFAQDPRLLATGQWLPLRGKG